MKVGSLVVCVSEFAGDNEAKPVIQDKIYTIREIDKDAYNDICVRLEEIVNKPCRYIEGVLQPMYDIERFRELDTPTEIKLENILELEIV